MKAVIARRCRVTRRSPGAGDPGPDLLVRPVAVDRMVRLLAEAETSFIAHVVRDGGIIRWRLRARERFAAAHAIIERSRLSDVETADLLVALLDVRFRDWCWLEVEGDPDTGWSALWSHLVRHALPPFRADPLFLLAWTSWRRGEDGLARAAVTAARAEDPAHRAADMLQLLLDRAVPRTELPSLAVGPDAHREQA